MRPSILAQSCVKFRDHICIELCLQDLDPLMFVVRREESLDLESVAGHRVGALALQPVFDRRSLVGLAVERLHWVMKELAVKGGRCAPSMSTGPTMCGF